MMTVLLDVHHHTHHSNSHSNNVIMDDVFIPRDVPVVASDGEMDDFDRAGGFTSWPSC